MLNKPGLLIDGGVMGKFCFFFELFWILRMFRPMLGRKWAGRGRAGGRGNATSCGHRLRRAIQVDEQMCPQHPEGGVPTPAGILGYPVTGRVRGRALSYAGGMATKDDWAARGLAGAVSGDRGLTGGCSVPLCARFPCVTSCKAQTIL